MIWRTKQHTQRGDIDLSSEAVVMGILNVTPDSFSDGGEHVDLDVAVDHARQMRMDGALIIDIGGESTRPGAVAVTAEEEMARVVPVISKLRELKEFDDVYLSIDTSKAAVAESAIGAGADIVNDVSGCTADSGMIDVIAGSGVGVVVMHMQGTPINMQDAPSYEDVQREVRAFFSKQLEILMNAGVKKECVCFDPGIGFGKTDDHNLNLLTNIDHLNEEGRPVLLGVSRKSLFGRLLGIDDPRGRDAATVAMTTMTRSKGCMLHRVHDVKGNHDALRMTEHYLDA